MSSQSTRLIGLDALRGIAALVIAAVTHAGYLVGPTHLRNLPPVIDAMVVRSDVAVDLFFVLSGFVFTHVYFARGNMTTTARQFFVARFARLYPLHLLTLIAATLVLVYLQPRFVISAAPSLGDFVANLFLVQSLGTGENFSFNTPSWSISVEVACYAIFYTVARWCRFDPFAFACIVAGLVLIAFGAPLLGRGMAGFFVGCLAYRHDLRVLALLSPLALVVSPEWFNPVCSLTLFPFAVSLAARWKAPAWAVWLGDRSFSLYLIHLPVYWTMSVVLFQRSFIAGWPAFVVLGMGLTVSLILAELSFRYFERPSRLLFNPKARQIQGVGKRAVGTV